jgi:hypothetical protein
LPCAGKVVDAFNKVIHDYQFDRRQLGHGVQKNQTIDRMGKKMELLHNLRTRLLPSLKQQIFACLQSLDVLEYRTHPCPDSELSLKILSEMYDTVGDTMSAVDTLAMKTPLPNPSHDGSLKDLKLFRLNHLMVKTKNIIRLKLCTLLDAGATWILVWDGQNDPNDSEFQIKSVNIRKKISRLADETGILIDDVIESSTSSDLAILQEGWRESAQKSNKILKDFSEILNGTHAWRERVNQSEQEANLEVGWLMKPALNRLGQSAITTVKLTRLLYAKLTNSATSQLPFTLDPGLNSEELDSLRQVTFAFDARIRRLFDHLCTVYVTDENTPSEIEALRKNIQLSICSLEGFLLVLAFHIAPLHAAAGRSAALQRDFKAWFLPLKNSFLVASTNLQDAVDSCFGYLEDSESD